MDTRRVGHVWHLVTAITAVMAIAIPLVLVLRGGNLLTETGTVVLGTRIIRFWSYFTIWSNALVAVTTITLVLGQTRFPRWWRVLRLNAIVCIAVTGLVHLVLLRPQLTLTGIDAFADNLAHVVVPLLAVVGWAVFGPRGLAQSDLLAPSLALPLVWLGYTLVRGAIVDWYPYPFLDVDAHGYPFVLLTCVGVAALLLGLTWVAIRLDPRLPGAKPPVNAVARSPRPRPRVPR